MSQKVDRRRFLQGTSVAALTATGWLASGQRRADAIEPIKRNGQPKFKFSLAAYSYRKLLTGNPPALTLLDFIDDCAALGLEGTELTSYYFPKEVKPEYLRKLKRHAFRLGLDISGTAVGNDFGHPEGSQRQQQIEMVKQWIEYAEILSAPVIRVFAGHKKPKISAEQTHELIVSGLQEVCEYAGKHGIHLALENHGGPTASADGLMAIVNDVDSPWFGVNLDTGNFRSADVYGDLARVAPYALNVQVKVVVHNGGTQQPADYARIADILRQANYRGYVVLEYEEAGAVQDECRKHMDALRKAFSA
jgi:sugar phosphate isomerase/epimerase